MALTAVELLEKKVARLNAKIEALQAACPHPAGGVTKVYGSNTGNYDPASDVAWHDFRCADCSKDWTEYCSRPRG